MVTTGSWRWLDWRCGALVEIHLDVIVWVGAAAQAEAHQDTAASHQEDGKQDVDQGGGPEGIQVERLVTVHIWVCRVLLEVWPVDGVDPDIACRQENQKQKIEFCTKKQNVKFECSCRTCLLNF